MDIYSKVTLLTTNAPVNCKGILVQCTANGPRPIEIYTYGATFAGQTSAQLIDIPNVGVHIIPIQLAGVSFDSNVFPCMWGLN